MTSRLVIGREAADDLREAIAWYREHAPSQVERFRLQLEDVYASISDHPESHPVVYRRFRRALMRHFPYSVFYIVEPEVILVIGVVHQARDESTWKRRA